MHLHALEVEGDPDSNDQLVRVGARAVLNVMLAAANGSPRFPEAVVHSVGDQLLGTPQQHEECLRRTLVANIRDTLVDITPDPRPDVVTAWQIILAAVCPSSVQTAQGDRHSSPRHNLKGLARLLGIRPRVIFGA